MPTQPGRDTVEFSEIEATVCVLQDHAVGLAQDSCRANATQQER
jgi:hypothetical protein